MLKISASAVLTCFKHKLSVKKTSKYILI